MAPLRILMMTTSMCEGGATMALLSLMECAARPGVEIDLLVTNYEGFWFDEARKYARSVTCLGKAKGVRLLQETYEHVRRGGYDVVHGHRIPHGSLAGAAAGVKARLITLYDTFNWPELSHAPLLAAAARATSRFVAISEHVEEYAVRTWRLPARRCLTIPLGIDLPAAPALEQRAETRARLGVPDEAPAVGTISRLNPEKGIDVLLRAWPGVLREHPAARLLIRGDGPEREKLEAMAREITAGSVRFLEHLDHTGQLLAGLDVYVQPSRSEGFGLALVEAMAHEVACIGTSGTGCAEVTAGGRFGKLVAPDDVPALEREICALLRDPTNAQTMGRAAREHVLQRYDRKRTADQMVDLYRSLLNVPR
jgi:glycosyltransferase involved in cell wall biosynthesis